MEEESIEKEDRKKSKEESETMGWSKLIDEIGEVEFLTISNLICAHHKQRTIYETT